MRNPSRTAATAAALMIGVALVSVITVLAASLKASIGSIIDSAMRADYVVSSGAALGGAGGFSPSVEAPLAALPQVSDVAAIRSGMIQVYGKVVPVVATDPVKAAPLFNIGVTQGSLTAMTPSGIAVSTQAAAAHDLHLGSPVAVSYPTTGTHTYTVQVIYSDRNITDGDYVLPLAAAAPNFPQALDLAIYIKLAPGVTTSAARPALNRVLAAYPNVTLQDQDQYKTSQQQSVNSLVNLFYGLLVLAIVIAMIGIANTLALSVYERIRELGLLRAVGMTRRQLRASVRVEALVISLFGAAEGLVLGSLLGCAIVAALGSSGVHQLAYPAWQLIGLAILAGLTGLLAAVGPSRRAARLDVLRAIATE